MFTRPKPEESEEDILRLQEEFLRNKSLRPSGQRNKRKSESDTPDHVEDDDASPSSTKRSMFAVKRNLKKKVSFGPSAGIHGEVKERVVDWTVSVPPFSGDQAGFPQAFVRDEMVTGSSGKSIFSEQISKLQGAVATQDGVSVETKSVDQETHPYGERSYVVTGPDSEAIHRENTAKLSEMSAEEVEAARANLVSHLDPNLVKFLRLRGKEAPSGGGAEPTVLEEAMTVDEPESSAPCPPGPPRGEVVQDTEGLSAVIAEFKWLKMGRVEVEKLEWMRDLPSSVKMSPDAPYDARFDFQGELLPFSDQSIAVNQGLHHHGEEPERPGYTVQELYQLSRSSVPQQRILALTTLANILDKTKAGNYDKCLTTPLLVQLVDSSLILLLRFSLDDSSEGNVTAAVLALSSFLGNEADEACLDRMLGCHRGYHQPSMAVDHPSRLRESHPPPPKVKKDFEPEGFSEDDETYEPTDSEMAKLNVVITFLNTDGFHRLGYILETLRPGPRAVMGVLNMLVRIVRHSRGTAGTLLEKIASWILDAIVEHFLPTRLPPVCDGDRPEEMRTVYGVPLAEALKLMRLIASWTRSYAERLIKDHHVMESVVCYIGLVPGECGLAKQEVLKLTLQSFYIWQTFLLYNLATEHFTELLPVLMRLLHIHVTATDISGSALDHEHGSALLSLVQLGAAISHEQETEMARRRLLRESKRWTYYFEHVVKETINHSHVVGFVEMAQDGLRKWLSQLATAGETTFSSLKLVSATFNFLAEYYSRHHNGPHVNVIALLETIEDLATKYLLPFLQSTNYDLIMERLKSSSCLLDGDIPGTKRDHEALPSLGALLWGGHRVVPVVGPNSSVPFVQGLANFLAAVYKAHKGFDTQCLDLFLDHPHLTSYLKCLADNPLKSRDCWFVRYELQLLATIVRLATNSRKHNLLLFHNVAFILTTFISKDDKQLLKHLLQETVFNPDFFKNESGLIIDLKALKLSDNGLQSPDIGEHALIEEAFCNIASLGKFYDYILRLGIVPESTIMKGIKLTSEFGEQNVALLQGDWPYAPITEMYTAGSSGKPGDRDDIKSAVSCLQWVYLLECTRATPMSFSSVTTRFCRLSTLFLASSNLFLEGEVSKYLRATLYELLKRNSELDFKEKVSGFTSFYDLYTQLLEQFSAVSYGDKLFGLFLLVPLQRCHSADYRKLVWGDQAAVLRVLSTPIDQLMIPLKEFLEPCETEPTLLRTYLRALAMGQVREAWCPVLHRIALHHVATYVRQYQDTSLAKELVDVIDKLGNKEVQSLILSYN